MTGQPASAPLPWSVEFQLIDFYLDNFTGQFRSFPIRGKQGHLPAFIFIALKHINGLAPRCMLAVIYLAKIEHLSLNNTVVRHSMVLNDTPVAMFFAVFKTLFSSKKHAPIFLEQNKKIKGVGRHYKRKTGNFGNSRTCFQ